MKITYVIGYPASGKSTAVEAALKTVPIISEENSPFKFIQYEHGYQLGAKREGRSGTDALPYSVQPKVLKHMEQNPLPVIGEGDRLANNTFFRKVIYMGWELQILLLEVPVEESRKRCFKRRSTQLQSWVESRITKTNKLKNRWHRYVEIIDGTQPVEVVANQIKKTEAVKEILNGSQ